MTESICLGCGLCCDGTVVSHLAVADESDVGAPLRRLGVVIIVEADPPVFELPCPALADGVCTVHDMHRPNACAQFECSISRAVLEGSMEVEQAKRTIDSVKELRVAVDAGARPRRELEKVLDREFRWWVTQAD